MAEQPKPGAGSAERSTLNAVASVRAAQEQMQGDIDKLRKDVQAVLVICLYVVGALAVTYFAAKGAAKK